jgi:hypothetical protein
VEIAAFRRDADEIGRVDFDILLDRAGSYGVIDGFGVS